MRVIPFVLIMLTIPCFSAAEDTAAPAKAPEFQNYIYIISPAREGFFDSGPTADESKAIGEHWNYLLELHRQEVIVLAGRGTDNIGPGIVVFRAKGEAEADAVFQGDPAVAAGVFKGTVHPLSVALWKAKARPAPVEAEIGGRAIIRSATVTATLDEAWERWTTCEGLKKFLAADCDVELRVGGKFEIYFDPNAPEGSRGSEGCTVLSFLPKRMLSFSWNAPPSIPEIRDSGEHTHVVLDFADNGNGTVTVTLAHLGWKDGEGWDKTYRYFDSAWTHVMDFYGKSFSAKE